jgi:hypothetical protein
MDHDRLLDATGGRTATVRSSSAIRQTVLGLGAGRYITGGLSADGEAFRVNARLHDAQDGMLAERSDPLSSLATADSAFARLIDQLLLRGAVPSDVAHLAAGSSLRARQVYLAAHRSLAQWDLVRADSLFDAATR